MLKFISKPVTFRDAVVGVVAFELLKLALPTMLVVAGVIGIVWAVSHYGPMLTDNRP